MPLVKQQVPPDTLGQSRRFFSFILDETGACVYANELFQAQTGKICTGSAGHSFFADQQAFQRVFHACLKGEIKLAELSLITTENKTIPVQWEFLPCSYGEKKLNCVQAVGYAASQEKERDSKTVSELKIYDENLEGIWVFEMEKPITISAPPDEILEHFKNHSYMSECNDALAAMYGFEDVRRLVGARLTQLIDFSDQSRVNNLLRFIKNGLRSTLVETREFNRYGDTRYFLNNMEGIIENGIVRRVRGIQVDITPLRQAEENMRQLAMLVENVSDIILSQDTDRNIVSWNKAAEKALGWTAQEMMGKQAGQVLKYEFTNCTYEEFIDTLRQKGEWQGEVAVTNRWGNKMTLLNSVSRIFCKNGRLRGYVTVGKDITEKKQAEQRLLNSEVFYRNMISESLDGILLTDEKGIVQFVSPSVTRILGYTPDDLMQRQMFTYVHAEDEELAIKSFANEINYVPETAHINIRLKHKQGHYVWCLVRGHNMLSNPFVKKVIIYFADNTLHLKAEEDLAASVRQLQRQAIILNSVSDVILTTGFDRVISSWNKVAENITGISENDAVGHFLGEVLKIDAYPYTMEQVVDLVIKNGIWHGEISITGSDREKKYLLQTFSLLYDNRNEAIGLLGVGKDITERKAVEKQILQSELFYRSLTANSLDGILLTDEQGKIRYCGASAPAVSGYREEDLLGKQIFDFIHPDDIPLSRKAFLDEVRGMKTLKLLVIRLRHASRGWVWCKVRGHNLLHDSVLHSLVIYFSDDTVRKEMEDHLKESESRFRNLIQNISLGIIMQNEKSEVLLFNRAALTMLGLTEEQIKGRTLYDHEWNMIQEDGTPLQREELPSTMAMRLKKPVRDVIAGILRPGFTEPLWLLLNAEPTMDEHNEVLHVICTFADVTEQRKLAQQLLEQEVTRQKLITQATIDGQEKERQEIGKELHDNINQHLTTARLYLEVASEKSEGELREMIRLAHKNLTDIVDEIRRLSQSLVPSTLGDLGLTESIQDLCDGLARTHSYEVRFQHRQFDESAIPANIKLMVFRIIQEQISNIIRHAQAGAITICLQSDAENLVFSVADNGKGFDPLTTKKGLGLSNISNRASLFGGKVSIHAAPGKGCTITVSVPVSQFGSPSNY